MSSKSARRSMDYRRKKQRFYGNQHSKDKTLEPVAIDVTSASSKKLCLDSCSYKSNSNEIFLSKFTPIVSPVHQHSLVYAVPLPLYPRYARLERDLATWLAKDVFDKL
ncbi:hypothetical protein TNCV_4120251 [Trichonephila clavipes]|nr:hypothetical protein TNCV_4120251 [Trichonephila clavipes]